MRDLQKVIKRMMAVIPPTEKGFLESLESNRSSAEFSAPELMRIRWECTAETLEDHLPEELTEDWQKEVVDIWMARK